MATDDSKADEIVRRVAARTAGATDHKIIDIKSPFLDGELYTVAFSVKNEDGEEVFYNNRVYSRKNKIDIYPNDELLISVVGQTHKRSYSERLLDSNGIAGIIAIMLTITICYLSLKGSGSVEIPDILTNGLSVILGFYFAKTTRSS